MRINKKLIKKHRHANQFRIPSEVKTKFTKAIKTGNVPSSQQIKMAVNLGLVKRTNHGNLDSYSLANYFKTFIQQRRADDQRR